MLNVPNADVYTDFNGLAKLKNQAKNDSKAALHEVAKQFESLFLNNVLKSMREAKLAEGALDNDQSQFYKEMYDQQLAVHLSGKPGVGLADLIVKQLGAKEPTEHKKMAIEDYLNRSAGEVQAVAVTKPYQSQPKPARLQESPLTSQPYHGDYSLSPVKTVESIKNDEKQPIQSAQDFIRQLWPYAQQAAGELGLEPRALLAQAALETGWGRSVIKNSDGSNSFNLFNIKADKSWQGKQAQVPTWEFDQGLGKKVNAGFRSYGSYLESFQDYVGFIKSNPRYSDALKQASHTGHYLRELQQAGYATDPNYADKIMAIYQGIALPEAALDQVSAIASDQSKRQL